MKSLKVVFPGSSYPLYYGEGALEKFSELTALYRFPHEGFLITRKNQKVSPLAKTTKLQKLSVPKKIGLSGYDNLEEMFSILPWSKLDRSVTLVVLGDDLFLNLVSFATRLIDARPTLIWVPTTPWAMIECGVRSHAFLAWEDTASILSVDAVPNMVILDLSTLESNDEHELLPLRTGIMRNLLLVDRIRFSHFEASWHALTLGDPQAIYSALESALTTRMAILEKGSQGRYLMYDFGLRAVNQYRIKEPLGSRELALLVLVEISWRLKLAERVSIGNKDEISRIYGLIEGIKAASSVDGTDWSAAKKTFQGCMETSMMKNIHLPTGIGNLQKLKSVDKKDAEFSLGGI